MFNRANTTEEVTSAHTIIQCEMFIIPNPIIGSADQNYAYAIENTKASLINMGVNPDMIQHGDQLVEVWVRSNLADNMSCHRFDLPNGRTGILFPSRLPLRMLKEMKEGDVLVITDVNETITLRIRADRLGFRYRGFGKFEEVLKKLLK